MEAFADRYLLVHMARAREESEVHDLVSRLFSIVWRSVKVMKTYIKFIKPISRNRTVRMGCDI